MSVYPTDQKDIDTIVLLAADGAIHKFLLDMNLLECKAASKTNYSLSAHDLPCLDIAVNLFDPKIFFVLERDFCEVIHADFKLLVRLNRNEGESEFRGAKFLSGRTLLIWDSWGCSSIHYIGSSTDLKFSKVVDINPQSIVLVSDGISAIYVDCLDIGSYQTYTTLTRIALVHTSESDAHILHVPSTKNQSYQRLVSFTRDSFAYVQIECCPFWASLFGSNVNALPNSNNNTLSGLVLSLYFKEGPYLLRDLWKIDSVYPMFSSMVVVSKTHVAVGFSKINLLTQANGYIFILPQVTILLECPSNWASDNAIPLNGHLTSVSALYMTETQQRRRLLFSGDQSGHVNLWDLETGSRLAKYFDHSGQILRFLPVPPEIGGKLRNSVVSVGQDNSLSVINVEDFTRSVFFLILVNHLLGMRKALFRYIGEQRIIL